MPSPRLLLLGLVLLGTACEPTPTTPTRMMVLLRSEDGLLRPAEVELTTLSNPVKLEGSIGRMIGGARIVFDPDDVLLQNATSFEQVSDALLKDEGSPVRAEYFEQNGVLWPADFHSWNMATAYYHLETATQYFRNTGAVPESALDPAKIYYFPEVRFIDEGPEPQVDNAMWFPLVQGLLVLPFDELQKAPMSINGGVMTHEYSHRIFNRLVYRGAPMPAPLADWGTVGATPGINVLRSLDEGFADFHAVAASCRTPFGCDPRYFTITFEGTNTDKRDLEAERCMSSSLLATMYGAGNADFGGIGLQYEVGTLVASALWQAGQSTGQRESLEQALLDAYSDDNLSKPGLAQLIDLTMVDQTFFTLGLALSSVVAHVSDPTLKLAVCSELADHVGLQFGTGWNQLACPDNAVRGTTCPVVNP